MTKTNNNLVSSAKVNSENKYSEFTTLFRIPFKEKSFIYADTSYQILESWKDTCIKALEMRMDACISMLFRNRNNVLLSNEIQIVFRKSNGQLHSFNHSSFQAMEKMINDLKEENLNRVTNNKLGITQLLKALYWIPEEDRKDHNGFGFGQLISCLERFLL